MPIPTESSEVQKFKIPPEFRGHPPMECKREVGGGSGEPVFLTSSEVLGAVVERVCILYYNILPL